MTEDSRFYLSPHDLQILASTCTGRFGNRLSISCFMADSEAARLLRPGGRYGIHELCLVPDELPQQTRDLIERDLATTIRVGAQPLTTQEWCALLTEQGFNITRCATAPMHLLELPRLIQDEGLWRVSLIASRLLRDADARSRLLAMKKVFRTHDSNLRAITIIGRKP